MMMSEKIKAATPYENKEDSRFWKTGVVAVELGKEQFSCLNQFKPFVNNPRISSIGSCFAQHVGKWLQNNKFNFNQSHIEKNQIASFAFGNIYTPRCFIQWLDMAEPAEKLDTIHSIYHESDDAKYFDLLRPLFNQVGFDSQRSLQQARTDAVNEMVETIKKTDVFILTLGLIEAWKDINGIFYPSCPGVISGEFDQDVYEFHEFNYLEIKNDVEGIRDRLRKINPDIRILLTVSPVPLTATATNKHILVASAYSKSVLRAVAGFLASSSDDFEYFPSYEIITVPTSHDFRFESNLRTVTPKAVDYVMNHFRSFIGAKAENNVDLYERNNESAVPDETVCDEEMLEAVRKINPQKESGEIFNLTLIGDSHMGKLSSALTKNQVKHCGGMVMNGSGFAQKKFVLCDEELFVPLENASSRVIWSAILKNLNRHQLSSMEQPSTVITNIGMQTHQTISRFVIWMKQNHAEQLSEITQQHFIDYFNADQSEQFSIIFKLHKLGHNIIVVSDPPFSKYFQESKHLTDLINLYFDAAETVWQPMGVRFVNAARMFEQEVIEPEHYTSGVSYADGSHDWCHGNEEYYLWLSDKLISQIE